MASISVSKNGILQFRHPHVKDDDGYGLSIKRGVAKFSNEELGRITDGLGWLLDAQPLLPSQVPPELKIHQKAQDFYFGPMKPKEGTGDELWGLDPETPEEKQRRLDKNLAEGLKQGNLDGMQIHGLLIKSQQRNAEQEETINALRKQLGARKETEKALTLWDCLFHAWFYIPMREGSKNTGRLTMLRRAGAVLDALGLDRPYCSVTKDEIIQAVTDSGAESDFEKYARKQAVKRVLTFLCKPEDEDGLGFSINPAKNMVVGSISALQNKKRRTGGIAILDPMPFIKKLAIYEQAMAACLGFAGLRLAECAALTWDRIDFEKKLIMVGATDHYEELKSDNSYRIVPPFQNIWPILKKLKAANLHPTLLFPRQYLPSAIKRKRTRETWFDMHNGDVKVIELSNWFRTRMQEQTGLKFEEPARRLRRYWETKMRAAGFGDVMFAISGHDDVTGKGSYAERQMIAAAAKVGKVSN